MKLRTLLLLLFACGWYAATAQSSFTRSVTFGVKAGVNMSLFTKNIDPFDVRDRSQYFYFKRYARISGMGGLTADLNMTERITIGIEILYSSRGMAYREENDDVLIVGENGEEQAYNYYNFNIDYLELPITVNYNFLTSSSRVLLSGYVGMAPGFPVTRRTILKYARSDDGTQRKKNDEKADLKNVSSFNNSIIAGIKAGENHSSKANLYGELRTSYTLLPVFDRSESKNGNNMDTRMFTLSIGIGFKF